jgi:hypothetical protein
MKKPNLTLVLVLALLLVSSSARSQTLPDTLFLKKLMERHYDRFQKVLSNPNEYRIQILYTQIDRDKNNVPHFKSYSYRLNPQEYFYPASTVKLPACLLALEKLNELKAQDARIGIDKNTPMLSDSGYIGQIKTSRDNTSSDSLPTIGHYIKKILLVSDNDAFNRLYEFVGPDAFTEKLKAKGLTQTRIVHRLEVSMNAEQNRRSNPIRFIDRKTGLPIYEQGIMYNPKNYYPDTAILLGKGNMQDDGTIDLHPKDFSKKNAYPLAEQQALLKRLIFPETFRPDQRFKLTKDDYTFIYKWMSALPRESDYPKLDTSYYDGYVKFLLFGNSKQPIPDNYRIFNKVGDAYGFMIDNAYIVDFDKKIEFMLSTTIYANSDGIFNDDKYDYDTISMPFFENLGKVIYEHELQRKKKILPDLKKFR